MPLPQVKDDVLDKIIKEIFKLVDNIKYHSPQIIELWKKTGRRDQNPSVGSAQKCGWFLTD